MPHKSWRPTLWFAFWFLLWTIMVVFESGFIKAIRINLYVEWGW